MESQYTSDELFHFVGHSSPDNDNANYGILKEVLKCGCISPPPHDGSTGKVGLTINWDNRLETGQLIVPNVTCYADIPFEALSVHTDKYGKFGIALPRRLLTECGARPVMYIPMWRDDWRQLINGRNLLRDIESTFKGFKEQVVDKQEKLKSRRIDKTPDSPEEAIYAVYDILRVHFLSFIKPFNAEVPLNHHHNFYMEREWRKYGNMDFEASQVSKLVVAKGFGDRTVEDFPAYADRVFEI